MKDGKVKELEELFKSMMTKMMKFMEAAAGIFFFLINQNFFVDNIFLNLL
jgi:hypothetical protein